MNKLRAYSVHLYTASGMIPLILATFFGLEGNYQLCFLLMIISVFIDGTDGFLARFFNTKKYATAIDGALMDNCIDYYAYVVLPSIILVNGNFLPSNLSLLAAFGICISSAFQFSNIKAKTSDHFFLGFPSYWNILLWYIVLLNLSPEISFGLITTCIFFVFIPIKYVYPSRPEKISRRVASQRITQLMCLSILILILAAVLLPTLKTPLLYTSISFSSIYIIISIYRTIKPLS